MHWFERMKCDTEEYGDCASLNTMEDADLTSIEFYQKFDWRQKFMGLCQLKYHAVCNKYSTAGFRGKQKDVTCSH